MIGAPAIKIPEMKALTHVSLGPQASHCGKLPVCTSLRYLHPRLTTTDLDSMCLVEVERSPKPVASW
jgi:hypothetical protein